MLAQTPSDVSGGGGGGIAAALVGRGASAEAFRKAAKIPSAHTPSEAYYKQRLEVLGKENVLLKERVGKLERANAALKRSLYELTLQSRGGTFTLDSLLEKGNGEATIEWNDGTEGETLSAPDGVLRGQRGPGSSNDRSFSYRNELKGHKGAVYCVQFASEGPLAATGSFDKTVRVWDCDRAGKEMCCLAEHQLNVADVCWGHTTAELVSASYDHTVKLWDVHAGKCIVTFQTQSAGFLQSVVFIESGDHCIVTCDTRNAIFMFDRRVVAPVSKLENDSMVNSITSLHGDQCLLTGDARGMIKTWDIRRMECVQTLENDENKRPITHIHVSPGGHPGEDGRLVAVNSYDNVLRVYARDPHKGPSVWTDVHALKGMKNQNMPIRSAFYRGPAYVDGEEGVHKTEDSLNDSLLLATGSTDRCAYIYGVGCRDSGELLQKLEGHSGGVYATAFRYHDPLLATASADATVKLWTPTGESSPFGSATPRRCLSPSPPPAE